MKSKIKWIIWGVVLVLMIIALGRLLTPEDTWIFREGKWIKHGQPSSSMPEAPPKNIFEANGWVINF